MDEFNRKLQIWGQRKWPALEGEVRIDVEEGWHCSTCGGVSPNMEVYVGKTVVERFYMDDMPDLLKELLAIP